MTTEKMKMTPTEESKFFELCTNVAVYPNYYTGTGRFSRKSADHHLQLVLLLERLGFKAELDFETGNDAPRKGWSGLYVRLTDTGRMKADITNPEPLTLNPK